MNKFDMTQIAIGVLIGIGINMLYHFIQKTPNESSDTVNTTAYERVIVFLERLRLQELSKRTPPQSTAIENYVILLQEIIRQEWDFNLSQQLYISPIGWKKINEEKEKTIQLISSSAQTIQSKGLNAFALQKFLAETPLTEQEIDKTIFLLKQEFNKK